MLSHRSTAMVTRFMVAQGHSATCPRPQGSLGERCLQRTRTQALGLFPLASAALSAERTHPPSREGGSLLFLSTYYVPGAGSHTTHTVPRDPGACPRVGVPEACRPRLPLHGSRNSAHTPRLQAPGSPSPGSACQAGGTESGPFSEAVSAMGWAAGGPRGGIGVPRPRARVRTDVAPGVPWLRPRPEALFLVPSKQTLR